MQHARTGQDILMLPLTSFLQKKPLQCPVQRVNQPLDPLVIDALIGELNCILLVIAN